MYEPLFLGKQLPPVRVEITALDHTGSPCARCKRDMVTMLSWAGLTTPERKLLKKDFTPYCSRGLCRSCYNSLIRVDPDAILDYPRSYSTLEEFVENLQIFRRRTTDRQQLAKLSGMTVDTYDKALTRARKAGLL
jgi:hypothetical protein